MSKQESSCKPCEEGGGHSYHHGDLHSALIDETARMVAEGGTQSVTIRELAKRLEVSRNAPYRHFGDKTELLCAVAEVKLHEFAAILEAARHHPGDRPLQQLHKMGLAYLQFAQENGAIYKMMFSDPLISENKTESLQLAGDNAFGVLLQLLGDCQQQGAINNEPLELQGMFVWSTMHGLSSLLLDIHIHCLPIEDQQQMVESTLEMIQRGLGAEA
ncbi:MAG: TetR family transcriptional regulator [Gammaproteobacteria bacterium]|nr:TetR family transcriptional regulator [Gammaproteobacteria bacterium]